jgi:MATE family multidrug resistance protein
MKRILRSLQPLDAPTAHRSPPGITDPKAIGSTEHIGRLVNNLAWPVIAENLLQTLLTTVDMMMVASLGASAVAGVGAAFQVLWVIGSAFSAVNVGTTVLVAHFIGARDTTTANRVTKQALVLSLASSLSVALMGTFLSEEIIVGLGAAPDVVQNGAAYLRISCQMNLFMMVMFTLGSALRGAGDTQTPMRVTAFINVINVIVAYGLIFGHFGLPAMGVAGSAWAASIARIVGSLALFATLLKGHTPLSLIGKAGWRPEPALIWRMLRLGIPSSIEQVLLSGGMLIYGMITIALGTNVYAAQRITFNAISIGFMPGLGFAMAATALTGQSLGAKKPEQARLATWHATRSALIWMSAIALAMFVFGRQVMRLFSNDPEIIAMGADALKVIALTQPAQAIGQVLAGGLRGAGDTRYPMWVTTAAIWLVRLPLAYLFGPVLGLSLAMIYLSNVADSVVRAVLIWNRYRRGAWQHMKV